ncbi:hypothetical protein [Trinickia diaoshuihuensis]|uniref:antitoxin PaaA2 family protein n=1 Tax=Trinickia diaoshuihuensis TaxID=2292265 RepID=UPI000E244A2F|nr:hypothetical protein [Trinickia diaoshuihuensis]
MTTDTIDQKTLSQLVRSGAVNAAHVEAHGSGWTVAAKCGLTQFLLLAKRGDVRVFAKLETLVGFLHEIGIDRFDVDASAFDRGAGVTRARPDRAVALKEAHAAHAYDKWFRDQVQESLDDPRPNVSQARVTQEMSEKKAALRRKREAHS